MVIGHEKGSDTESRIKHNFGMAMPEGYRKAVRLMEMADRFSLPVITLVDTAGAYPGIGAEERGQAEAIARSTDCCLGLGVPIVAVIIGEGGSGGAVAIATANRILMLEHAIYSVISPEGAASILWRDSAKKEEAATTMKITAQDLDRTRRHRHHHPRTGRRRAPRPRAASSGAGDAIAMALAEFDGNAPRPKSAASARTASWRWAAISDYAPASEPRRLHRHRCCILKAWAGRPRRRRRSSTICFSQCLDANRSSDIRCRDKAAFA